jgi:thiol-disulfide isomerase/thioredoxin
MTLRLAVTVLAFASGGLGGRPLATASHAGLGQPGATFAWPGATFGQPGATFARPGATFGQPGATFAQPGANFATWSAVDIDGQAWSAEALRGRVVLVDFWATWCAPCLDELPRLKRLHARHAGAGLTIIGVSLDRSSPRDFRSWLQRQGIGWPQVREAGMYDSPLARTFAVEAIPASFLFGRDGRQHAASLRGPALEARVDALMETR